MKSEIIIRKALLTDYDQIWQIIRQVIATGDTYVFDPGSSKEKMLGIWCGEDKHTFVATIGNRVVGTFMMRDNFPDLGSHIVNAGYMTLPALSGKGIGRAMAEYSLKEAKKLGYNSMQYNMVIKTNLNAIRLWKSLGFKIIGEIPGALNNPKKGLMDAYIMWKEL